MKTKLCALLFFLTYQTLSTAQGLTLQKAPSLSAPTRTQRDNNLNAFYLLPLYSNSINRFETPPSATLATGALARYQFNPANLPFFCKIEYDMAKGKKIPFKFRLGDVQYVDELEKKK